MLVLQDNISILSGQIFDIRPSSASRDFKNLVPYEAYLLLLYRYYSCHH